ncbi:hypothetical protein BC936DRAFT_149801 [Jimgerdemannia flammicorona]|uniref:Uncharacterized protein n=1 Tax=Jimgerdemannia flammicorona TaxID=994334 RepID=A0A433DJP2_9FUNG|nr:hypothetical protein BC936DRAFT_149801 [Jimgerdemannia flammicorona]
MGSQCKVLEIFLPVEGEMKCMPTRVVVVSSNPCNNQHHQLIPINKIALIPNAPYLLLQPLLQRFNFLFFHHILKRCSHSTNPDLHAAPVAGQNPARKPRPVLKPRLIDAVECLSPETEQKHDLVALSRGHELQELGPGLSEAVRKRRLEAELSGPRSDGDAPEHVDEDGGWVNHTLRSG